MSRPSVSLSIPPHLADLDLWGRDVGGAWWALIVWTERVSPPDGSHPHSVACAAWASGRTIRQTQPVVDYLEVRRMQLGAEPAEWPSPTSRPGAVWSPTSWYLGVLDGSVPVLPAEAGEQWGSRQGSAYDS